MKLWKGGGLLKLSAAVTEKGDRHEFTVRCSGSDKDSKVPRASPSGMDGRQNRGGLAKVAGADRGVHAGRHGSGSRIPASSTRNARPGPCQWSGGSPPFHFQRGN